MSAPIFFAGKVHFPPVASWLDGRLLADELPNVLAARRLNLQTSDGGSGIWSVSLRLEAGKRGGDYWYAYMRKDGKLYKRYVCKSDELTVAALDEVREKFYNIWLLGALGA